MAGRSPARFLAPIALIAFAFALYSVVKDDERAGRRQLGRASARPRRPRATATKKQEEVVQAKRKTYTVKSGDTPSGIAEKTGSRSRR